MASTATVISAVAACLAAAFVDRDEEGREKGRYVAVAFDSADVAGREEDQARRAARDAVVPGAKRAMAIV